MVLFFKEKCTTQYFKDPKESLAVLNIYIYIFSSRFLASDSVTSVFHNLSSLLTHSLQLITHSLSGFLSSLPFTQNSFSYPVDFFILGPVFSFLRASIFAAQHYPRCQHSSIQGPLFLSPP